ncbi:efflux RND transporter permease subunit [Cellulosilyticum sp. I15G10I2]|uniref:efflux RND transporter permease subunit n=1 Tax=Cellulosilyticum sp. I15G10I2 TaxID=1892843 RepID=UPI00085CC7FC|nr:efflux RND transporter permease subunit [Cellulosilyticum sp. I15G10I2]
MNVTKVSVKRPLTIIMVFCVLIVFGYMGFTKMPLELMPDIEIPVISVSTVWGGAGPEDIDTQVTKVVEDAVSAVNGVDTVVSYSMEGVSVVILQFEFDIDMIEALNNVRNKVELVQANLPDGVNKSTVSQIDITAMPISQLVITSDLDDVTVMRYAEDIVQPAFEQVQGITSADIQGGSIAEISVIANSTMLERYGVTLDTISGIIRSSNLTVPYGTITEGENKITLRTAEELTSLEQIKALQIPNAVGKTIQLDKVCDVVYGYADQTSIYRYNGVDSLLLSINKQQSANTVQVMKDAKKTLAKLNTANPDYTLALVNDESEYINSAMNNVWSTLALSSIIALIVILLFLKDLRASVIVAVAIPLSIIGAVAALYFSGQTLNLITVGGLVLGVGMVVDNSIVVIENIFNKRHSTDLGIHDSAIVGTTSVTNAILASTLTSVAVFLPIFFTTGIAKIMFGALAQSIIYSLLFSIVVSITLVPSLFAKLSTGKKHKEVIEKPSPIFDKVKNGYEHLLKFCLTHKSIVIIGSLVILIVSFMKMSSIGMDLMPVADEGALSISMELPKGLSLESSDYYLTMAEEKLSAIPEIKNTTSSLGSGGNMRSMMSGGNNTASISVNLVDKKERERSTAEVSDDIRTLLATIPDCKIAVSMTDSSMGGMGGSGYSINVQGPDLDVLEVLAKQVEERIRGLEGFQDVESSLSDTTEEAQIKINTERALEWGINTQTVTSMLRMSIEGSTVTTAKIDGHTVDVNLKLEDEKIQSVNDLLNLKVRSASGENIPIGAFSHIVLADGLRSLSKTDGNYSISISATLKDLDMGTAQAAVLEATSDLNIPRDYSLVSGSNMEMMMESFASLAQALGISVILVYMVMVAQFESFKKPFIIMFSVPFAFVGVVWSLALAGSSLSIPAFIGIILLVGIVVNNGIVLIDYIEQLRKESDISLIDAVAHGSATRLRPVLMTTLTTVLAMVPQMLALGEGSETMQPMGIVVFGGLSISTLVTLLLIPTIYILFERHEEKKQARKSARAAKKAEAVSL